MRLEVARTLWEKTRATTYTLVPNVPTLADLKAELRSLRPDLIRTLRIPNPKDRAGQAALIEKLERSAKAEQRFREIALDYMKPPKS